MLRTLGADLVGMSTALEAIAARAAGIEVFGLSLVTNAAAGVTGEELDADEVIAAGKAAAGQARRASSWTSSDGCERPAAPRRAAWADDDPHAGRPRRDRGADRSAGTSRSCGRRFAGPLTFGTAGLRGPLRAGPGRDERRRGHPRRRGLARYLDERRARRRRRGDRVRRPAPLRRVRRASRPPCWPARGLRGAGAAAARCRRRCCPSPSGTWAAPPA